MYTKELSFAFDQLPQNGFLDVEVDPTLDLVAEIKQLKKEKKT